MASRTDILRMRMTTEGGGKVRSDLSSVNRSLGSMENQAVRMGNTMRSMAGLMGTAFGAFTISQMASATKQAIEFADSIAKTADNVGVAVESLQEYRFAAERSGVSTSQLDGNLTAFVKRVGEARAGIGPLTSFLKKYDETLLENIRNTKTQEEAMDLIADAIENAATATDRAAIANAAFSRSGIGMVNMLRNGSDGLAELRTNAREAGFVIDEALTRKAEIINDRWDTLTDTLGNRFKSALITAADASLNFLKIYNDLDTVLWELVEAEERLLDAEERMEKTRGRNFVAAQRSRNNARKDIETLREQEAAYREMEERIKSLRESGSVVLPAVSADGKSSSRMGDTSSPERNRESIETEYMQRRIERIQAQYATERELELQRYEQQRFDIEESFQLQLVAESERKTLLEALEKEHQDRMTAIDRKGWTDRQKFDTKSSKEKVKTVLGDLATLTRGVASSNKTMFQINKAAAIGNAILDTHAGIVKTMGTYPYPISIGMAALQAAAGFAQVSAIRSTSYGGGGSAPSLAGTGATTTVATLPATQPVAEPVARTISIEDVNPEGVYSGETVRELIKAINEQIADGVELRTS